MHPDLVRRTTTTRIPTEEGTFQLSHYVDTRDGKEHLALVMGDVREQAAVLARVHSECFTGDVLGSQRCDCGEQLHDAMRRIAEAGQGVIIYLRQEGRGIGLEQKLKAYNLQDQGYDTVDANLMLGHQADEREYSAAAAIMRDLGIASIRLMTNNPAKIDHLAELGVTIVERMPLSSTVTKDNAAYLATKIQRMRHLLTLPHYTNGNGHANESVSNIPPDLSPTPSTVDEQIAKLQARIAHHNAITGRPLVTLSYAQTLNGTIGVEGGGRLPISGPESMLVTHKLRAAHDAILVGIGTLLADDPRLTARLVDGASPQPIIVDSHLRTRLDAKVWSHPKPAWIATLDANGHTAKTLEEHGASLIAVPPGGDGRIDLDALLQLLAARGIRSLMVEGGAQIITSFLQRQLADIAVITIAPRIVPGIRAVDQTNTASTFITTPAYYQAGADMILWGDLQPTPRATSHLLHTPAPHQDMVAGPPISTAL